MLTLHLWGSYSVNYKGPHFLCANCISVSVFSALIFSNFACIYSRINPRQSYWIASMCINITSLFAATPLLLVLNTFQLRLSARLSVVVAQPRSRGNKIIVIFSVEWCNIFLLLWQKMLVGCMPQDLILYHRSKMWLLMVSMLRNMERTNKLLALGFIHQW